MSKVPKGHAPSGPQERQPDDWRPTVDQGQPLEATRPGRFDVDAASALAKQPRTRLASVLEALGLNRKP